MAGTCFEYFDGYLRVDFSRVWHGDIYIDFHLHGDAIASIPCDDDFVKGKPELAVADDVTVRAWTSPTVSSFFTQLVRWLEAITCGVSECAFRWEGEGPDGEMRWLHGWDGSGHLMLSWTGNDQHGSPAFEYRVRLNEAQMVRMLYESFRSYVESDRFDRLEYERLEAGEVFALVLEGGDLDALAEAFVQRDRASAYRLLHAVLDLAGDSKSGYPRRASLSDFIDRAATIDADSLGIDATKFEEWVGHWFDVQWYVWDSAQRYRHVIDIVYRGGTGLAYGERVYALRSTLVEDWLARQP